METKFTPGPWAVADSSYDRGKGDEGPRWDVHVPNAQTVAEVCKERDARLIAAAPALYEELIKARDTFRDFILPLRIMRRGLMADACQIAKDSLDATLAAVNVPERDAESDQDKERE